MTAVTLQEPLFQQTRQQHGQCEQCLDQGNRLDGDQSTGHEFGGYGIGAYASFFSRFDAHWSWSNSTNPGDSAVHACQSAHILGPDVANSFERKYCRMATSEIFPYCETEEDVIRFDFDLGVVRPDPFIALAAGPEAVSDMPTVRTRHEFGGVSSVDDDGGDGNGDGDGDEAFGET